MLLHSQLGTRFCASARKLCGSHTSHVSDLFLLPHRGAPLSSANAQVYQELIDAFPLGIVVISADRSRRIIMRNAAAIAICKEDGHGMSLTARSIRFSDPRHNDLFAKTLRTGERLFLQIHASNQRIDISTLTLGRSAGHKFVAIIIQATADKTLPSIETLRRAWGVTDAEAHFVLAFAETQNIRLAAHLRGITEGTARQYLKRIYNKVDVRGQAPLIRKLMLISR